MTTAEDVVEETILAAKPGWQPPKPKSERRERNRRSRSANRLQEGDEVLRPTVRKNPFTSVGLIGLIVLNLAMGLLSQPFLSALAEGLKNFA